MAGLNLISRRGVQAVAALSCTAALALMSSAAISASKTYTVNADFALGSLSGVNFTAVANQLQLDTVGTTFPVMWIANAGEDTVSKFDTVNNKELARYRTWFGPAGQAGHVNHLGNAYAGAAPSRTAVDLQGNAYVLNRWFSAARTPVLVKILSEGFIDRNGNGVADTSVDTSGNGIVEAAEMKAMADTNGNNRIDPDEITDERIAWAVEVGLPNGLGRALCIGTDGHLWVGMFNARTYYKVSSVDGSPIAGPVSTAASAGQPNAGTWTPYGCLIDGNGVLWSASLSGVLGKITNTASNTGPYTVASFSRQQNYGVALGNGKVYLGLANDVFDPAFNTYADIPNMTVASYGIVVDGSGNVIAGRFAVRKVSPAGALLWEAPLQTGGAESIGIQIDSNNDVWQVGFNSAGRMQKYRGTDGAPLGVFPVGNMPYTYSDAAGFSARNITNNTGTWTVTFDGGAAGTQWGKVNWSDLVPALAGVVVQVRSADTQAGLPSQTYQNVSKNVDFSLTGRFIQILTRLNANPSGDSPILFDLTVASNVTAACDIDGDGDIDSVDIGRIRQGYGQTPAANDPRDANGDRVINVNDARTCATRCTRTSCAAN